MYSCVILKILKFGFFFYACQYYLNMHNLLLKIDGFQIHIGILFEVFIIFIINFSLDLVHKTSNYNSLTF